MPRKAPPPQFDPIETPALVFISSSQNEFSQDRAKLKGDIDEALLRLARPLRAIVVERQRGAKWDVDMEKGIEKCDIFILLLGTEYSDIVRHEFQTAHRMNIPIYVYVYLKPRRVHPRYRKGLMRDFLQKDILPTKAKIRGYNQAYRNYELLLDETLADLAYCVVQMVHEAAAVRRVIGS
jgi:hypothetical protein